MKNISVLFLSAALVITLSAPGQSNETYVVDVASSQIKWTGYHLAKSYEHYGFVNIKSGKLGISGGTITSGEFIIDMASITNTDVTKIKDNDKLVNDLKSDNFFAVKTYPEAKLVIRKSEPSGTGLNVTGDLTIRGITRPIEFKATLKELADGKIEATTDMNIQRTDYKVMYGWKIENAIISGEFRLEVRLIARKA
jgi:polyisoprenoid-binding protein YceI